MKKWILTMFLAVATAATLSACATPEQDDETASDLSYSEPADDAVEVTTAGLCCSYGTWMCPNDHSKDQDYATPRCGQSQPTAKTRCNNACGPACVNTGWDGPYCD